MKRKDEEGEREQREDKENETKEQSGYTQTREDAESDCRIERGGVKGKMEDIEI